MTSCESEKHFLFFGPKVRERCGTHLVIEVKSTTERDERFHWTRAEFQRAVSARERVALSNAGLRVTT